MSFTTQISTTISLITQKYYETSKLLLSYCISVRSYYFILNIFQAILFVSPIYPTHILFLRILCFSVILTKELPHLLTGQAKQEAEKKRKMILISSSEQKIHLLKLRFFKQPRIKPSRPGRRVENQKALSQV